MVYILEQPPALPGHGKLMNDSVGMGGFLEDKGCVS